VVLIEDQPSGFGGSQALPYRGSVLLPVPLVVFSITVLAQGDADFSALDGVYGSRATLVPLAFLAHSGGQMARTRRTVLYLSIGGKPESLLGPLVGFHLRHDWGHSRLAGFGGE
jgi:hypothetical protein